MIYNIYFDNKLWRDVYKLIDTLQDRRADQFVQILLVLLVAFSKEMGFNPREFLEYTEAAYTKAKDKHEPFALELKAMTDFIRDKLGKPVEHSDSFVVRKKYE